LHTGAAGRLGVAAEPAKVIDNLVLRNSSQPPAKRVARLLATKLADVLDDGFEDFLKNVGDVLILQSPAAAPMEDERTIEPHEAFPSVRLIGSYSGD
jgi:hypothetical protein